MEKIKVIIADDIQAIVESNKRIVASFDNVEVIGTAYNGQDEYDMIINLQPDLVITDNQMPIMNGIDVIKNIVSSDIPKKPSFVLVTGDTGGIFRQAYDLGVFRVISKMSSQSELKYTIEEFLSLQNVRQDERDNIHQKKHFKLFGNRKHKIKKGKNFFIK